MEIDKVLFEQYLPYAKGVIIDRAIPDIDGLKPAQRRILYTMYTMGLINGNKTKSSNIVGQTMKLHPHGDSAIYETMVRMATGNESLNVPYVESKGNFGKVYSRDMAYAAPRYTEAKLAKICSELFDGINENAVDFVDNFDSSTTEPTLLPVKFPSVLVNPSSGLAVGTSSSIPSFDLGSVCRATVKILKGEITSASELMDILGVPEFSTGGNIHILKKDLDNLGKTGSGNVSATGNVEVYGNKIVITEIPYKTYSEDIINKVVEKVKSGELKEVSNIHDETGLAGFKITVDVKRGCNSDLVLRKLLRLTNLHMKISFITRVIINDECKTLGLLELLEKWIEFRISTVRRVYQFRLEKQTKKEHLLSAWEKIQGKLKDVIDIVSKADDEKAIEELSKFGLDKEQVDYFLDMKIRSITKNNQEKKIKELAATREEIEKYQGIISSENEIKKVIVEELEAIEKRFGTKRKTHIAEPLPEEIFKDNLEEEKEPDDTKVRVIMTKKGMLKRFYNGKGQEYCQVDENDKVTRAWDTMNGDKLLVFLRDGTVHKLPVKNIDTSKGALKDSLINILNLNSIGDILFVDMGGDYTDHVNIVYSNGKGYRVPYSRVEGKRAKYINVYDSTEDGRSVIATKEDQFLFLVKTSKGTIKAAYCNLVSLSIRSDRAAFKIANVNKNDDFCGIKVTRNIPNLQNIDLSRYTKGYCVMVGDDKWW